MCIKNFSKNDCNVLKMLIHPGLVQVHEATKIRSSKSAYLFLLPLFSQQFPNSFSVSCPRSQTILLGRRCCCKSKVSCRVFFLVYYYNSCSNLKCTGDQCGWKPLLLPHVLFGQQENICLLLLHGCSKASITAS